MTDNNNNNNQKTELVDYLRLGYIGLQQVVNGNHVSIFHFVFEEEIKPILQTLKKKQPIELTVQRIWRNGGGVHYKDNLVLFDIQNQFQKMYVVETENKDHDEDRIPWLHTKFYRSCQLKSGQVLITNLENLAWTPYARQTENGTLLKWQIRLQGQKRYSEWNLSATQSIPWNTEDPAKTKTEYMDQDLHARTVRLLLFKLIQLKTHQTIRQDCELTKHFVEQNLIKFNVPSPVVETTKGWNNKETSASVSGIQVLLEKHQDAVSVLVTWPKSALSK